jgi:hypothetical protein
MGDLLMNIKAKLLVVGLAASLTSGCTIEEMQSFALGATVALAAASLSEGGQGGDDYTNAYGPTSCDYGYTLELGYDEYDRPVRFCAPYSPYMSQEELNKLSAQAQ